MFLESRKDAKTREDFEHFRRAARRAEIAGLEQLGVDFGFLVDAQAIGHLDDADAVEEGFVVLVALERVPFRFIGMGEHHALIGHGANVLGAAIIAFLCRRQQGMQHLDRRLEHLDEFQHALRRAIEAA